MRRNSISYLVSLIQRADFKMEDTFMKLRTSSIPLMLEYAAESGMDRENNQKAADILNHEDYLFCHL